MKIKLDTVITVTLVVCALVTTGILIHRELFSSSARSARPAEQKPVLIAHWRDDLGKGTRLGPAEAPVQLLEFADFECPYCAGFHKDVKELRVRYPTQVTLTYVHFPLPGHRFALPAARVAECAGDQGRFEAMYDLLFDQQDQFGLKAWSEFATEAGVPDDATFETCIKRIDPIRRVVEGEQLGEGYRREEVRPQ